MLFDRSWYNRAGVERVMGFCTPEQHAEFMRQAPLFEQMLVHDGISLIKLWFSVSRRASSAPGSRSARSTRCGSGSSPDTDLAVAGQVGRLHRGQGRHVRLTDTDVRAVDGGQEQRQEARPHRRDALRALGSSTTPTRTPTVVGTPDPLIVGPPAHIYETGEKTGRVYPLL